ncbi:MAG: small GTP-binding protein [Promethearchaeota archaeon CR_4]|nr:MAG: small GTP-binding protein [Candidatus Lokiarchaeota archaeon CR_4]
MVEYRFKIVVSGDPSVGKTTLIRHFCEGFFRQAYLSTIGVSFLKKEIDLGDDKVAFSIWDVGGQQIFQNIRPTYYKGAHGALILFDVTNISTLAHATDWVEEIHIALRKIPIYLVGNKIDLPYDKANVEMGAKNLANRLIMKSWWTSAKTGDGMNDLFESIARDIIKEMPPIESR